MEGLDDIPWGDLTHAYGSAEDVPELLTALETATSDMKGEDHPIWHLFGNIYHQGTVYEATSHAVPFLIELLDSAAPDKESILLLLAAIARGGSYVEAHSDLTDPNQTTIDQLNREKNWVKQSRDAVGRGFDTYKKIFENNSEIRFQTVNLLASIPSLSEQAGKIIRDLVAVENTPLIKAGLLIELARTGDRSSESIQLFLDTQDDLGANLRTAGAIGLSKQDSDVVTVNGWELIKETVLSVDYIDSFYDLPWEIDIQEVTEPSELYECLPDIHKAEVVEELVTRYEGGESNDRFMWLLIPILFPDNRRLSRNEMNNHQLRMVSKMSKSILKRKFTFSGALLCFGLPDSSDRKAWKRLK